MALATMTDMLLKAKEGNYAVPQFNIINMEFTQAIIETCSEENSPVILGIGEGSIKYMGIDYVMAIVNSASKNSRIPIALHLDHGSNFEVVMQCIRAGFSSVMIDGSQHSFEKNVSLTKKVVEAAHAVGVSVEGELGSIQGTEDDITVNDANVILPSAKEAIEFWNRTRVDALAVAVGTAHGMYKSEPDIKFNVLAEVSNAIPVPLVLHGGSGVATADIRKAIECGVSKINVNTENQVAFSDAIREIVSENKEIPDAKLFLNAGKKAVKDMVRLKVRLFNSNNKG